MASGGGHGDIIQPDLVDELIEFLAPSVTGILERIVADEFTTVQFIEILQSDEAANADYEEALRRWGEGVNYAKMVIHGQVIPAILRRSPLVEWAGYAHGLVDPYAVPAWWTVKPVG
jgi:hypothetical protein